MKKQITVVKDPETIVETQVLEQAIVDVSTAAKKLLASRLTNRAIQVLIKDASGGKLGLDTIQNVLDLAAELEGRYLKREGR